MSVLFTGGIENSNMDIGDNIANSLMLDRASNHYLTGSVSAGTSTQKATISFKIKRTSLGTIQNIFQHYNASSDGCWFNASDQFQVFLAGGATADALTNMLFRDVSAWYFIDVYIDTTQATAGNRIRIDVNGVTQTTTGTPPPLNYNFLYMNVAGSTRIIGTNGATVNYLDGGLALFNFIDGQALTSSSFGRTSADTGEWVNKDYTGTYGSNGFKLDFTNASSLGTDSSGNGNNWTLNGGIASANQMYDTPTHNFHTMTPLNNIIGSISTTLVTYSKGNLQATSPNSATNGGRMVDVGGYSFPRNTKLYWEVTPLTTNCGAGIAYYLNQGAWINVVASGNLNNSAIGYNGSTGTTGSCGTFSGTNPSFNGTTDVLGLAWDGVNGVLQYYKNGASIGSFTGCPTNQDMWVGRSIGTSAAVTTESYNYGQKIAGNTFYSGAGGYFQYAPPAGYLALQTVNKIASDIAVLVSGTFTGNANADGVVVSCNGYPTTLTINGNAVTFGTHADRLAHGFKLRTNSASYNANGANTWTATVVTNIKNALKYATAQGNP